MQDQSPGEQFAGTPSPDALLPKLDERQLNVLGQLGREWVRVLGDRGDWQRALPVDPSLRAGPGAEEVRPKGLVRFVPISGPSTEPPAVEATTEAEAPPSPPGRIAYRARRVLLGPPLTATAVAHERMRKLVALPVLSADALASVAYGPEAMLAVLVLAGTAGLRYSLPIAATIAVLMVAVGVSYRQTVRAYPHGGGSYIVASDNLGRVAGLVAAAGLLTDYILDVAVSIAAGVAAVTSAIPWLGSGTVLIGVGVIAVLLAGNLRGVRQAGAIFAAPTYAFIVAIFVLTAVGLIDAAGRHFHPTPPPPVPALQGVTLLLLLRAFSSGSTAMTGIEAVSNAVPAFHPPEWRNARTTLTWMVGLLLAMYAGTVVLMHFDGVVPNARETVLSQLAHRSFGSGVLYAYTQAATAAILLMAANTAYNDFPRVLFLLARTCHAPRLFLRIGDRLGFSNGIIVLSLVAAAIYVGFGGQTNPLIPLFAVGVFLAFTMSQGGMVVHWWRHRDDPHWRRSLLFNAIGGCLSAIVFITAAVTKFTEGAWVAVLAVGLFVAVSLRIRRHYDLVAEATMLRPESIEVPVRDLKPDGDDGGAGSATAMTRESDGAAQAGEETEATEREETPQEVRHLLIVPVEALDRPGIRALAYAASLQQPVLAVHLSPTAEEAERFRDYWRRWGDLLPLEVVVSPHRAIVAPLVNYVGSLHYQRPDLTLTAILPEIVARHWWHRILQDQTAPRLRRALRPLPKIIVTSVPFHLRR
ncbi:MAG TPA: APC family permease [Solirubrobacteraceae bacterium]|nr:APC family permease [Solirubrobacteraceae bacterium]